MNNTFPQPPPDRRLSKTQSMSNRQSNLNDIEVKEENNEFRVSNMSLLKMKHIEDMRKNIFSFKLFNDKEMFITKLQTEDFQINNCNIILFGPSGSGKSSFIQTLYRALYGTTFLPPEAINKLIIKETTKNEGTLCFTRLFLKEQSKDTSGITVCDTRGHIWMNADEKEQFKLLIDVNKIKIGKSKG